MEPLWARYVAGVVAEMQPQRGVEGDVSTTIPIGAGLSSSAALEVAVALALVGEPVPRGTFVLRGFTSVTVGA